MTTWMDFRDQAIEDWQSSIILQEKNKNGNSAYLLQQSLEKLLKSVVMKYKLSKKNPEELNHLPIIQLWVDLQSSIKEQIEKTNSSNKATYILMKKCILIIGNFFKQATNDYKEIIWKESLGIKLELDEKKRLWNLIYHLKKELEPVIKEVVSDYKEMFESKLKPFLKKLSPKQRLEVQQILDKLEIEIKIDEIDNKIIDTSTDISKLMKDTTKFFDKIEKLYCLIMRNPRNKPILDTELFLTILLAWIFQFTDVILKTFVHESIGRYPKIIGEKNSRTWYNEKSESLEELRKKVLDACSRLSFITFNQLIFRYSTK